MSNLKNGSKAPYKAILKLWNTFDPIGVYQDQQGTWPNDEYVSYVGATFNLLKNKRTLEEIKIFIMDICENDMGLSISSKEVDEFAILLEKFTKSLHYNF
ncbi:MAG: hypothetical protein ACK5Z5_08090 [Neisseriaceae bacterium]